MGIIEYWKINSQLRRLINKIANKIKRKDPKNPITVKELNNLMILLGDAAEYIDDKKDYREIKSFCAGLRRAFRRAVELEKEFGEKANASLSNIITTAVFIHSPIHSEADIEKKYGGIGDIKDIIKLALNGLASAIESEEIDKARKAEAAAIVAA